MDELVRWLGVQLDEDERIARAVQWEGSGNRLSWELAASATVDVGEDEFYAGDRTIANHIVTHDPARVLREIDAKRRIIAEVVPEARKAEAMIHEEWGSGSDTAGDLLRLLALPYADRPGYKESWRP
ncbi:DUF6221 family protein [Streptomyces sp. DASNCL29]|uniref:DUF6221 family protein n=1 Tax=Streptomyces sp. DASNCL29 TaxID=2583819 RepID=UPI00110F9D37|nr:DUF6221 family protein [Streptomyces sp. DASNCL29]TMU98079.1 hypothetical protein FGK60_09620 [Streptomyces sp. DASNCL29]